MICAMLAFPNVTRAKEEGIFCVGGYITRKGKKIINESSTEFAKIGKQKTEILNAIENFEIPDQEEIPEITTLTFSGGEGDDVNYKLALPPAAKIPEYNSQLQGDEQCLQ